MTIDEAIKHLKDSKRVFLGKGETEYAEAEQLGIEALKREKQFRHNLRSHHWHLLPSETPQIDTRRSLHHIKEVLESPEVRK